MRGKTWWHLPALLGASAGYESLFLRYGLNPLDEGWPLYAAMRLHRGGVLYQDVFFVFPPGHLLPAWLAQALDPPGIVLARALYGVFNVALCLALYALGRRLMPPTFALLGALLLAVAAPYSHLAHFHFGYRYLVFSVLALLCFSERLRTGNSRWLFAAGVCAGLGFCFRFDPALAVLAGLGLGVVLAEPSPRRWWRDGSRLALGFLLVVLPVGAWLAAGAGLGTVWQEVFVRPVAMTALQNRPLPAFALPQAWSREEIFRVFVALQFRAYTALYLGYAAALALAWLRSRRRREPFGHALLAATVVFGGIYFVRVFGRSDIAHLESAIPPVCLLLAHLLSLGFRSRPSAAAAGVGALVLAAWIFLLGSDRAIAGEYRGQKLLGTPGERVYVFEYFFGPLDRMVGEIRGRTAPGDTVLDMSIWPMLYVLADRLGPGYSDILLPGTFLSRAEEEAFVARLEESPPAAVVWSTRPFDKTFARMSLRTAPRVARWVRRRYAHAVEVGNMQLLLLGRQGESGGTVR